MAPKHGLQPPEDAFLKRAKTSATPASRSATPADPIGKVNFRVEYPDIEIPDTEEELEDFKTPPGVELQISPFKAKGASKPGELNQCYKVVPTEAWMNMRKYTNFVIQKETYKNNHFVFVRSEDTPPAIRASGSENLKDFWVARILQVRAVDSQHVYALVSWMYWADELPQPKIKSPDQVTPSGGKRTYHGSHELIASNYMEVLDVLSFAGKADVVQWFEEDDNLHSKLYWRQTFCRQSGELSKIREHCICKGHFNPEVPMYICDNPQCNVWLHKPCLVDDILFKTYKKETPNSTNGVSRANSTKGKGKSKPYKNKFSADIEEERDGVPPMFLIKDLRPGHEREWRERISCPSCDTELE
ncbi:hypothetical protein BGZ60DRAFT_267120 [Tricladium varicosporioides]|nr:hypothetical protein BGZ60DRAFT_267120 [Hymenoscyphus varicosporioides]